MHWKNTNDIAFAIANETAAAIATAKALVREAEIAATAKVRSKHFTNCRGCQAGLENFIIQFPDCSDEAIQSYLEDVVFLECTPCTDEYNAHLERQAEQANRSLLEVHAYNGDDFRWQNGGVK